MASGTVQAEAQHMERVDPTTELGKILIWCSGQKATDLHVQADRRCSIRLDGRLQRIAPEQFCEPITGAEWRWACMALLPPWRPPQARRAPIGRTNLMQVLMIIWRTIVNLAKQAWLLPKTISLALQHRRRQVARIQFETERLDRIRNPSKYAGR
jgi:hypothetical protein